MSFKKIKEGDTVFIEKSIGVRFGKTMSFFVPIKVTRTTAKQIIVGGGRFRKTDGRGIGNIKSIYLEGEKVFGETYVKDQSAEMFSFIKKINKEILIRGYFSEFELPVNSKLSLSELENIEAKLNEINEILKQTL